MKPRLYHRRPGCCRRLYCPRDIRTTYECITSWTRLETWPLGTASWQRVGYTLHLHRLVNSLQLEVWTNAQRDGRPAEYRWRPLFNAAVWLTLTSRVPCSNAAKTRNPLKVAGVPQTNEKISAANGPKFTILWGHVEEFLLFNKFFFRLSICALDAKIFASCIFSEPHAARFRPAS